MNRDKATDTAWDEGYYAYTVGWSKDKNPEKGKALRAAWFHGYAAAKRKALKLLK